MNRLIQLVEDKTDAATADEEITNDSLGDERALAAGAYSLLQRSNKRSPLSSPLR